MAALSPSAAALGESRYRWFVAMSRVVEAEGNPQEAIALLDEAEQLYRPVSYTHLTLPTICSV